MRIISQRGHCYCDLPYEDCAIFSVHPEHILKRTIRE